MTTIKVVSLTCQDTFCDDRLLDAEVYESVIGGITTKGGTDYDNLSFVSSNDTRSLGYGRRTGVIKIKPSWIL